MDQLLVFGLLSLTVSSCLCSQLTLSTLGGQARQTGSNAGGTSGLSNVGSRLSTLNLGGLNSGGQRRTTSYAPAGAANDQNGIWFGTQRLQCVIANLGTVLTWFRNVQRRTRRSASRNPFEFLHRLVYYKGKIYEWGTSPQGYYMGTTPKDTRCALTWESRPAAHSGCAPSKVEQYVRRYRSVYGQYNLVTNNCHMFANRLVRFMRSSNCRTSFRETLKGRLLSILGSRIRIRI